MTDHPRRTGSGIFIVLAIAIGTFVGVALGQPTAGTLGGIVIGSFVAVALWLRERQHRGE
jgi:hypothetical protein